ncbi:MAG: hypothetical protein GY828_08020 [Candidatus Gracilibacteria bacterium]|nr:hypothetical protein [Candidatus Gracilibacteria bacterium]
MANKNGSIFGFEIRKEYCFIKKYMNYLEDFHSNNWHEITENISGKINTAGYNNKLHFQVEMTVLENSQQAKNILLYAHTTGNFTSEKETDIYLKTFCETLTYIKDNFPNHILLYIQNYNGFDPSKYIDYIKSRVINPNDPLHKTLDILPFENQRRVCHNPPKSITQAMPGIIFSENIKDALQELNGKKII